MSKYAVYELFNGCEAPGNISTFGGHLAGVRVGTSDKNPLDINDTTHHTSEPVRCKDCAYQGTHDCPAKDSAECMAFCSRGRKRDDDQR